MTRNVKLWGEKRGGDSDVMRVLVLRERYWLCAISPSLLCPGKGNLTRRPLPAYAGQISILITRAIHVRAGSNELCFNHASRQSRLTSLYINSGQAEMCLWPELTRHVIRAHAVQIEASKVDDGRGLLSVSRPICRWLHQQRRADKSCTDYLRMLVRDSERTDFGSDRGGGGGDDRQTYWLTDRET